MSTTLKYYGLAKEKRSMKFDYIFTEGDSNQFVYKKVKTNKLFNKTLSPSLQNVIRGYNTTVLCYGMTGAGKTYTMFGDTHQERNTLHPVKL
jgi:hypothetical protein